MDYIDIRLNIVDHINDIQDLLTWCIIDKLAINISSTKYFWIKQFTKYKIPWCNKTYNEYCPWVKEFMHCRKSIYESNKFINSIDHPSLYYCLKLNHHNKYLYKVVRILNHIKQYDCIDDLMVNIYFDNLDDIDTNIIIFKKSIKNKTIKLEGMSVRKVSNLCYYLILHIHHESYSDNFRHRSLGLKMSKEHIHNAIYTFYIKKIL